MHYRLCPIEGLGRREVASEFLGEREKRWHFDLMSRWLNSLRNDEWCESFRNPKSLATSKFRVAILFPFSDPKNIRVLGCGEPRPFCLTSRLPWDETKYEALMWLNDERESYSMSPFPLLGNLLSYIRAVKYSARRYSVNRVVVVALLFTKHIFFCIIIALE